MSSTPQLNERALQQVYHALVENNTLRRAELKQGYSLKELAERYGCGLQKLRATLLRQGFMTSRKGIRPVLTLDQVLTLDEIFKEGGFEK